MPNMICIFTIDIIVMVHFSIKVMPKKQNKKLEMLTVVKLEPMLSGSQILNERELAMQLVLSCQPVLI